MTNTKPIIRIEKLHKAFGSQRVLNGINLEIPARKITVIMGKSGEGKSVLLKHLIGLMRADAGNIWVQDKNISQMDEWDLNEFRKNFGMLFQDAALFDSMTVFENIAFPLKEHTSHSRKKIREIVEEKLALVGLKNVEHKLPAQLSGGMRKRVGLARAIALSPQIILYDEPTTGLDPIMTDSVDRLILEMKNKLQITSVVISHDLKSAFEIGDKIALLHQGEMIEEGNPEEFQKSTHPFVRQFLEGRSL